MDTQTRASLLVEALEAAGHGQAAVGIARLASRKGLEASTTVELIEQADPVAASLARVMLGHDPTLAPDAALPAPEGLTFADVKGMTTDEITARWPEVQKALAEGPK